jgi:hypothetical protein
MLDAHENPTPLTPAEVAELVWVKRHARVRREIERQLRIRDLVGWIIAVEPGPAEIAEWVCARAAEWAARADGCIKDAH